MSKIKNKIILLKIQQKIKIYLKTNIKIEYLLIIKTYLVNQKNVNL